MATSTDTEGTINVYRAYRLFLGPCTDGLRDVLRHFVPPATLSDVLKKNRRYFSCVSGSQRELILPEDGSYTGNYDDMDITLLYTLLRNICDLPPPSKGWGEYPEDSDRSLSASIERIRYYRKFCLKMTDSLTLSSADFNDILKIVRHAIVVLDSFLKNGNKYQGQVDILREETVDPIPDRHSLEKLRDETEGDTPRKQVIQKIKEYMPKKKIFE